MATRIRLMRMGKIRAPYYRIVVADSRVKRDGRAIETIGKYHPKENPSLIEVDSDRVQHWLSVGAQPTEPVAAILRKTGDWQKFKGEPAPPPLQQAPQRVSRKAAFEEAAREAAGLSDTPTEEPSGRKGRAGKAAASKESASRETASKESAGKEAAPKEAAAEPAEAPNAAAEAPAEASE